MQIIPSIKKSLFFWVFGFLAFLPAAVHGLFSMAIGLREPDFLLYGFNVVYFVLVTWAVLGAFIGLYKGFDFLYRAGVPERKPYPPLYLVIELAAQFGYRHPWLAMIGWALGMASLPSIYAVIDMTFSFEKIAYRFMDDALIWFSLEVLWFAF